MKIKYDKNVDALYILLSKAKVHKTLEKDGGFLVDVDKKGHAIGIEILNYSETNSTKERFQISSGERRIPITA
ncbi:MAG: DUF2283 domain-containing protein [bacterium]|nr:DUF2283 domain-containing protein [bacterium]